MSRDLPSDIRATALAMANAARLAIAPYFRALDTVDNKKSDGHFDPVTAADRAAERAMRHILSQQRPDDGILGEEYGAEAGSTGWTWYLDPIDGTRAFIAGLPVWTTLIGLVDEDQNAVFGVIDQPVLNERYIGGPDGSELHTETYQGPLHVSACQTLQKAVIASTDPFILSKTEQTAWSQLHNSARIVRYGLDAYAYARLAAGTIDLVAEAGLQPYDTAALLPIIRGAGGLACDWQGQPARPGGQLVCAASQNLLDEALISLRPCAV